MGEKLGPRETRKAIRGFIELNSGDVTVWDVNEWHTAETNAGRLSTLVDPIEYVDTSLRIVGAVSIDPETGIVRSSNPQNVASG